jgi:hypothetical protein
MFEYGRSVSEWRWVWQVWLEYAEPGDNGGYPYREVRVTTVAELRRLIVWARDSRAIVAYPYRRIREQQGQRPERCRNDHPYTGDSATRVRIGWTDCACGGHLAYLCARCRDVRVDPPLYADCTYTEADVVTTARRREGGDATATCRP